MRVTLAVHILAGGVGLLAGAVALYAVKGARLHRRSGRLFVYAMLAMATFGLLIAVVRGVAPVINIPAAVLTAYLVVTGLTTVRPPAAGARGVAIGALSVAVGMAVIDLALAFNALGHTKTRGLAYPLLMFATVGLLAGAGDLRVLRRGALTGAPRLARHLWRMCFALFIAALSFFLGQAKVFPKPIRIYPLLALPVLTVLLVMIYWLWRVRRGRAVPGTGGLSAAAQS